MFVFAEIVICSQVDLREARAALEKRRQRRVRDARAAREVQRRQGAPARELCHLRAGN